LNAAAHVSNALDAAAAALTVTHSDAVCQCHCHGLGLISLRAARERLHSRSAVLWAVQTRSFRPTADRGAVQTQSFRPTLRIERHHDRFAFGPLSRQHQLDVRVGLTIEISRLETRCTHLAQVQCQACAADGQCARLTQFELWIMPSARAACQPLGMWLR
jgi:hypothetical protein